MNVIKYLFKMKFNLTFFHLLCFNLFFVIIQKKFLRLKVFKLNKKQKRIYIFKPSFKITL